MNDEEMKRLWQNQPIPEPAVDVTALVATARQKHRKFQRTILWRDFREVGVAIVLIPIWIYGAVHHHTLWTNYLMVPALVFVAGFMVIDRLRRRNAAASPNDTVVEALGTALCEVEHQIWLLGNVLWWYIGPIIGALVIHATHRMLAGHVRLSTFVWNLAFNLLIAFGVWLLNQAAVKRDLKPRRDELQKLLEQVR